MSNSPPVRGTDPSTRPAAITWDAAVRAVDDRDQRRISVALAILAVTLVIVVTLTVRATAAAWERSTWVAQVAEPARAATEIVQGALFTRIQGLQGLRATGSEEYG